MWVKASLGHELHPDVVCLALHLLELKKGMVSSLLWREHRARVWMHDILHSLPKINNRISNQKPSLLLDGFKDRHFLCERSHIENMQTKESADAVGLHYRMKHAAFGRSAQPAYGFTTKVLHGAQSRERA